jgi:hypothetical protein
LKIIFQEAMDKELQNCFEWLRAYSCRVEFKGECISWFLNAAEFEMCLMSRKFLKLPCTIIIIWKTAPFEPYPSLEYSVRLHLIFRLFAFCNFFLTARWSALCPTRNL